MFCILTLQIKFKTKNIHAVSYTFKMTVGYYTMLDKFVIDLQKKLEVFPRWPDFEISPPTKLTDRKSWKFSPGALVSSTNQTNRYNIQ